MAKRTKTADDGGDNFSPIKHFKEETVQSIVTILLYVIGVTFILAAFHKAGIVGDKLYYWFKSLLGVGYFLLPLLFFMLGTSFWRSLEQRFPIAKVIGSLLFFVAGLGLIHIALDEKGGLLGNFVSTPLVKLFDVYTSFIILLAFFIISILIVFETKLTTAPFELFWSLIQKRRKGGKEKLVTLRAGGEEKKIAIDEDDEKTGMEDTDETEPNEEEKPMLSNEKDKKATSKAKILLPEDDDEHFPIREKSSPRIQGMMQEYVPPPLSLLERDKGKPVVGDIKANANIIKRTLLNFGINVEMDEISIGPSVTRYALKPAEGVKLSRIVALQNDLSLALAAHPIRIEAPIPGKSLVGIEIPNSTKSTVGLATLLGGEEYQNSDKPLLVGLGKGISGKSHFANLAKMPHLLIAGTTGSGKSVTIHALITSLLFRNSHNNMKFIMIDPKRVELTLYNKIPHLLTPVITEAKKAILALKWAAKEMDRRYDILESESVRDIDSYHRNVLAPELKRLEKLQKEGSIDENIKPPEPMPYIVIIIDELADIMTTYPRELEAAIVRLAQMSRAVGIHLVLSTQRPSVNVITGLIKANIPSRLALQVSSQIDSRTILDTGGAEKLLGAGDMLFLGGEMSKPQRIQSAFISEAEVKSVVKYLAENYSDELRTDLTLTSDAVADKNAIFESSFDESEEIDDELYEQAREEIIRAGKASTSYIQRKLRVGYARAARLMDILEERGVIGPADGAKPREVLTSDTPATESSEVSATEEETTR